MNKFLLKLRVLAEFVLSISLGFIGVTVPFPSSLINIFIIAVALFFFFQALGTTDKINGYGPYHYDKHLNDIPNHNSSPNDLNVDDIIQNNQDS